MAKEICISSTPHETRLAILEDDQLAEIYYERENEYTLAGSIYNGRVTRVLPGMQSAFVDLGLERDAFLYVTDFMELEDSEETAELEKAAVSSPNQAPQEVRHNGSQRRQERRPEERRPSEEGGNEAPIDAEAVFESAPVAEPASGQPAEGASSGRRWRGRRHRRGGRGQGSQFEPRRESESPTEAAPEAADEAEVAPEIHASATAASEHGSSRNARASAPTPFVLPGESLSKYGGASSAEAARPAAEAARRPVNYAKPSTLIERPLQWDGSGLLPGESLSMHRRRPQPEPGTEPEAQPPDGETSEAERSEEVEFIEAAEEFEPEPLVAAPEFEAGQLEEETAETTEEELTLNSAETTSADLEPATRSSTAEATDEDIRVPEATGAEAETGASASHRIDPMPPSGFRFFGFGKKDKKEEEAPSQPAGTSREAVSAYAPGAGLIEEEVIEGEEFESVPHARHHKGEEHDLDDYEEETLPTQARTGDLGEMLQEAHLDHKIQLNFEEKNGDDEVFEEEEEEEGEPAVGAQPGGSDAAVGQRRERAARGRRGRGTQNRRGGAARRSMQTTDMPAISDLLKSGQEILVQIAKEPIAKKGARITSHIALPGRFLVFMPTVNHIGVSRKIASDEERHRLKRVLMHERGETPGGFIVRTAADGASEEELRADLRFLMNLWNDIKQRSEASKSPALIYHDLSLIERILRDQVSSNFSNIWVDTEADYERIVRFLNRFSPSLVRRVKLYTKETPLFEHFGIQDEISKALRSKVWLKSGGSIVINQTEALVAIDINTGKYVGKSARLEDTILKTNLDAVPEIVRQIRLRDLGGIIVIDFIDMDERKNRYKVMAALEEALKSDRAPTKVLQFNDFGLVAITRTRVKQSLERTLSVPCPTCQATGMVKSATTVANEIYTELRKMKRHLEGPDVLLRVNPETVKVLKGNNSGWLVEFEELTGKNILVKSDATLHPEQFDIQG